MISGDVPKLGDVSPTQPVLRGTMKLCEPSKLWIPYQTNQFGNHVWILCASMDLFIHKLQSLLYWTNMHRRQGMILTRNRCPGDWLVHECCRCDVSHLSPTIKHNIPSSYLMACCGRPSSFIRDRELFVNHCNSSMYESFSWFPKLCYIITRYVSQLGTSSHVTWNLCNFSYQVVPQGPQLGW